MHRIFFVALLLASLFSCRFHFENDTSTNLVFIDSLQSREQILHTAAHVVPSPRQLAWQQREKTAFLHFGINTFTDKEWGDGKEDPALFNPKKLDAGQWVSVLKEAGFKLVILTAKHHDGFCLWPSRFTSHSVKNSPWLNGQGDVVKALADACVKYKMDLGLYLSPWDRHEPSYGTEAYNTFFKNQLRELLTNYGVIAEIWFDGAVGEGPNGKKQVYDFNGYYELVRSLQPDASIAVMGPDVRWVGTESGYGRDEEWSVVPIYDTAGMTGIDPQDNIVKPQINEIEEDLGSITKIINAKALKWYPSEVDVSIRPGWFYHAAEDNAVKSPEKLLDIYFNSVGKNSTLLLNIPPDKDGLIPEKDANILKVFNYSLRQIFNDNLALKASVSSSEFNLQHRSASVVDGRYKTYWIPDENSAPYLHFEWEEPVWFNILSLSEQITCGQRVSSFKLEIFENDNWVTKISGTTVGYKRLLRFPYIKTNKARLIFSDNRFNPCIAEVGFYQDIPQVFIDPLGKPFSDSITISMTTNNPIATIHYSQNFTTPSSTTNLYSEPIKLTGSSPLLAVAINPDGLEGFVQDQFYSKAKYPVQLLTTPDPEFLHEGGITLCDGVKGDLNFKSKKWLGYKDEDVEVILDQGLVKPIRTVLIHSLFSSYANIFPPGHIKIFGSNDPVDQKWTLINTLRPAQLNQVGTFINSIAVQCLNQPHRFIKVRIENTGKSSLNETEKGKWLFISEIEIL